MLIGKYNYGINLTKALAGSLPYFMRCNARAAGWAPRARKGGEPIGPLLSPCHAFARPLRRESGAVSGRGA